MKTYTSDNPVFHESLHVAEPTDKAHADIINQGPMEAFENTLALKKEIEDLSDAAIDISYDSKKSMLKAENVQDALDILAHRNKQTIAVKTIQAADWQTEEGKTVYSFESEYPFAQYDLTVEPDGENVTDAQMKAWLLAKPVGSTTHNRLILRGTTPEVGIPVMVKVVKK